MVGELDGQAVEVAHLAAHGLLHLAAGLGGCGHSAVAGELAQPAAQRGEAVIAEGHREPGYGRLAHPGKVGHLGRREECRRGRVLHQAVRDAPLRRGEPDALKQPDYAVGVIHSLTLCMNSFTGNALGLGLA
ncbi:hypothetical protein Pflav_060540 [Phytohabitans flavus]|uniref:Uncharacterized protein n=1 Tax=Phytohabitans flavus TaxID=1076124 RepID=A0A6F8Y0M0_9ACTN|nr:hypothetical protein Pflav_060540 [Phytohabitans flavus]